MKKFLCSNEVVSIDDTYPYQNINLAPAAALDDLTRLAAEICQTPIALLYLIDDKSWLLKSQVGLDPSLSETYLGLCTKTILQTKNWDSCLLIFEDAFTEQRLSDDKQVQFQQVRFFVAAPLVTPQGVVVGILAVSDSIPRSLTLQQKEALAALSTQAISQLELCSNLTKLAAKANKRQQYKQAQQAQKQQLANLKLGSLSCTHKEGRKISNLKPTNFQTIFNTVLDLTSMIAITDHRGKIKYVNEKFCQTYKYTTEELIGKDHRIVNSGYHSSDFFKQMWVKIRRGDVWKGEIRNRAKDGTFYWVNTTIVPILNGQEKPCAYVSMCQVITERKRMENEPLSQVSCETDPFFTISSDLMCVIGWDGHFCRVNPAFEKMLSYTPEELVSKPFLDFVHPEDKTAIQAVWDKLTGNTEPLQVEHRYRCLDGSYKWLAWNFFGQIEQKLVYGIGREITPKQPTKGTLLERSHFSTLEADVGAALGQSSTLEISLLRCTDAMVQHIDALSAGIWLVDPGVVGTGDIKTLHLQAKAGALLPADICPDVVKPNQNLIGTIAQTKQPLSTQLSSYLKNSINFSGYPLIVDSQVVGVMVLLSRHRFSKVVHNVLGWVANAIALSVDRAWRRDELLSRWEVLLCRLANQIHNSLDLDTILTTAVTEIQRWLDVQCCYFFWYFSVQGAHGLSVTHEARDPELPSLVGESLPPHLEQIAEIIRNQKTLRVNSLSQTAELDGETRTLLHNWGITAGVLLPLKTHTGQLGAIACTHYNGSRQWSDKEVELLQAVVAQLAIAIEQSELFANNRAAAIASQTQAHHLQLALQDLKQTETWLIQTEKMSGLGQMVAGVAHEINNPVNFITGNLSHAVNYVQDLLDLINYYQKSYPNPGPEIQELIEEIDLEFLIEDLPKILSSMKMGAERINEIVLSLRNFSRLDDIQMKEVNIHEGIDSTLLILHNRLKPKGKHPGIAIVKEYGELPPLMCYAGQINQVFMNIISNAIDALETWTVEETKASYHQEGRPHGETENQVNTSPDQPVPLLPTIWIHTEIVDGNQAVIRIRDNGAGMNQSVVSNLFEPFFTTKPVGKGTGLGLSISYQIVVEKHGGSLKCISEPGQGAEFWITIPISPAVRKLQD